MANTRWPTMGKRLKVALTSESFQIGGSHNGSWHRQKMAQLGSFMLAKRPFTFGRTDPKRGRLAV
jgi:hypothetical protein